MTTFTAILIALGLGAAFFVLVAMLAAASRPR
jgi:hypothetical protein